ncbi:hypothetical protein BGW36DRAFT_399127 [Talaromyces proteolyticus]|uniref:Uncharacterized protein n=1 Tax=Talaromyces proteolyticus TaxID=1131652 RepID=A0AAD4PY13_9EURO|nr:uncharacterized protein BGW36DRAFT_399127 [Talaromyces proteolyticus]KAH8693909.1 hypothetical protein BGW36DRAFT_399127 [Talaromyces proteolyticus]
MAETIPAFPHTKDIWTFLFDQAGKPFPDSQVIFESATTNSRRTYADIRSTAQSFGANLQANWDWKKGDVLVILSPNSVDTPALVWGCHWAGGIVSPANPGYKVNELRYHLLDSESKGIVVHASLIPVAVEAAKAAGISLERVLVVGGNEADAIPHRLMHITQMLQNTPPKGVRPVINPLVDVAFLVYSSGTTGTPKGAMVTHSNVVSAVTLQSHVEGKYLDWKSDRILALLPTYHIYGLICLLHLPMHLGLRTVIMEKFTVDSFRRHVEDYSISHAYVAPPVVLYMGKDPKFQGANMSSLRMVTSGGAPLGEELVRAVYRRLRIPVRQAFGLTETTGVCHIQRWNQWDIGVGSNGPPLTGLEVKFTDENDQVVTDGEGELCIRGPTIFKGYHKRPESTARCLTPSGWFKTGDIGYQDKDGNLYITDRLKDLIKFKGYQVAPAELEALLQGHPLVEDTAVVGVFNKDIASEVPLAYVVLKDPIKAANERAAQILLQYVADRMSHYKRLRGGIVWINEIPKSPSGKILKRVLKERLQAGDQDKAIQPDTRHSDGRPKL